MELLGWRVGRCLLLVVVVVVVPLLLAEQELARAESQVEKSACADPDLEESPRELSLPTADEPEDGPSFHVVHGSSGRQRRDSRSHLHAHDRDHKHDRHRQVHRGGRPSHHRQRAGASAKHQAEPEPEAEPLPPLPVQPHSLSRSDEGDAHDLLDCQPQPGDRLLARSVVKADFRPLGWTQAEWFYPQGGRDQCTIHCVRVLDQRRDGCGGYPKIERGGVGHHYVDLSFKSDFSRGFHFVVEVYGQ